MKKLVRTSILIDRIDAQIQKNQGRIKNIAKQNYELRKYVTLLKQLPKDKPLTKADLEALDKTNRVGKFYDAAFHYERLEAARAEKEATRIAREEAEKKAAEVPNTDAKVGGSV